MKVEINLISKTVSNIFGEYKYKMATFTSSLPDDLLRQLAEYADRIGVAKNKIIEKALRVYLDQMTRAEYAKSYRRANQDSDIMMVAEEGMTYYLKQIEEEENS